MEIGESCFLFSGRNCIEAQPEDFTGIKIDRDTIKKFLKLHLNIDTNTWKYMPNGKARVLIECCM